MVLLIEMTKLIIIVALLIVTLITDNNFIHKPQNKSLTTHVHWIYIYIIIVNNIRYLHLKQNEFSSMK